MGRACVFFWLGALAGGLCVNSFYGWLWWTNWQGLCWQQEKARRCQVARNARVGDWYPPDVVFCDDSDE